MASLFVNTNRQESAPTQFSKPPELAERRLRRIGVWLAHIWKQKKRSARMSASLKKFSASPGPGALPSATDVYRTTAMLVELAQVTSYLLLLSSAVQCYIRMSQN